MRVARMQPEDRAALEEIAALTASDVSFESELARSWARIWVAHQPETGAPLGFVLAWAVADELHILNIAAHPAHRRRGVGRALMEQLLADARALHSRLVLLEVRRSNQPAIALYRAFGFWASGVRRRYYADNAEDAIEMRLTLDPSTGSVVPAEDEVSLTDPGAEGV